MPKSDTDRQAEERLQSLSARIDGLKSRRTLNGPAMRPEEDRVDYDRAIDALSESWSSAQREFSRLQASGGEQFEALRLRFNGQLRRLGSLVQRVAETVESSAAEGRPGGRSRYFLSPQPEGGWVLKMQGTGLGTKYFDTKTDAVRFSRRYVRGKQPSELVIRRSNGTFESIHRYGRPEA